MNLLPQLPFWAELLIFAASAVVIWVAGISLSDYTDVLADRLHLGQALGLGGLILLPVATNLPEIAITLSGHTNSADIPTRSSTVRHVLALGQDGSPATPRTVVPTVADVRCDGLTLSALRVPRVLSAGGGAAFGAHHTDPQPRVPFTQGS